MADASQILKEVLQYCGASFSFCIGVELEFYAYGVNLEQLKRYLGVELEQQDLDSFSLIEEEGKYQFELVFKPNKNILAYADLIERVRETLKQIARKHAIQIDFSAKPNQQSPGSAMHVHVSLYDQGGKNLYARNEQEESEYLLWSIAGLLEEMPAYMTIFAPHEKDYQRYRNPDRNTPATVSWGGENRTVALRIPAVGDDMQQRRIEHRVSSPNASVHRVMACIIISILRGIEQKKMTKLGKTHGNAWDEQYGLAKLPRRFEEAVQQAKPVL